MTLSAGTRLGRYEILSPIGVGGMGEVYRARDTRLGRVVAVKTLPASFSGDADRLRRFEQEAIAASALNHPNIITIYEIGSEGATPFIAMEFIEGASLAEALASGPLPLRRLLDISVQTADGLAKAHAAGIVHRDLKPENVMVSKDGYAKLLDFGLAKLARPQDIVSEISTAVGPATVPGTVMGTVGYMSPEQAAGKPADFRSDQFSLGSILYEMATGRRAFRRETVAETLVAIIRDEPDSLAQLNPNVPAPFRWVVKRCLAKDPDERYASTQDLARDLKSVGEHVSELGVLPSAGTRRRSRGVPLLAALSVLLVVLLVGKSIQRRKGQVEPASFHQLTFRRGSVLSARFAPDGQTILYTAEWDGLPIELFVGRVGSPESRPFGIIGSDLLAISGGGEIALSLDRHQIDPLLSAGMLARIGLAGGGAPREVQENVQWADWSPSGADLAIVRDVGQRSRLEFPIGKVLYETAGYVTNPRVSRDGHRVAFVDHSTHGDDGGRVAIVDTMGMKKILTPAFSTCWGLAWSPDGNEIWFTAAPVGGNRALYAVDLGGRQRLLARVTGTLALQDVAPSGRVLLANDQRKEQILGAVPGVEAERELSWLDYSGAEAISPDGKMLLFDESGEGGGAGYSVFVRKTDGSLPVRLGEGSAQALSPDGKWALALLHPAEEPQVILYPIGPGQARVLPRDGLSIESANWLPDGKRLLLAASEPGHGVRLFVRDIEGGKPVAMTPEGYRFFEGTVSPDGRGVVVRGPDQRIYLYPLQGGEPVTIPGLTDQDTPSCWSGDGQILYVAQRREVPRKIDQVEVATGRRQRWRDLRPADSAGVSSVGHLQVTPDGRYYVYSYQRNLSVLYLVEGLK